MLFRILEKTEFRKLVGIMLESNEVIGPKQVSADKDGQPIHQYLPIEGFQELCLDYETTEYSAKTYFLPYRENLSTFHFDDHDWTQKISYRLQPRVIMGLHTCDINALLKLDKVLAVRDNIPHLQKIIIMDMEGLRHFSDSMVMSFDKLLAMGKDLDDKHSGLFKERLQESQPEDLAILIYTSGTTGPPKGAMISHKNVLNTMEMQDEINPGYEDDEILSFLPLCHIAQRMVSVFNPLLTGYTINFIEELDTVLENMREVSPTFFFAVPRIWEKFYSALVLTMKDATRLEKLTYKWATGIGQKCSDYILNGFKPPFYLRGLFKVDNWTVLRNLKKVIGLDRARYCISGAAPISPELLKFYHGLGVDIREVYGQTENCGPTSIHYENDVKFGTVGKPLPRTECRISDIGEILSKSPSVCAGYFKLPEKTDELLEDGWLHSGDAGFLDKDGHLVVIDRISDVMHTKEGQMFSPMFLENKLKFSPYVKEAVIFGDQEDYVSVLINIDPIIVGKWAEDRGISFTTYMDLSLKPEVAKLIRTELEAFNRTVEKPYFRIRRYSILYKLLDTDDGELTKTGKIRRKFVREKYNLLYETLYDESIREKEVEAEFTYQDGQTTKVKTSMPFYTMDY